MTDQGLHSAYERQLRCSLHPPWAPSLELPDTVLFPDEFVQLTVSRTDPLLQLIAQAGAAVPQGDRPSTPIVKMGDKGAAAELDVSYQTHCARALLSESGVYPASRPELSDQLENLGAMEQARRLTEALTVRQRLCGSTRK